MSKRQIEQVRTYVILLENLLERFDYTESRNSFTLSGKVTPEEMGALRDALGAEHYVLSQLERQAKLSSQEEE